MHWACWISCKNILMRFSVNMLFINYELEARLSNMHTSADLNVESWAVEILKDAWILLPITLFHTNTKTYQMHFYSFWLDWFQCFVHITTAGEVSFSILPHCDPEQLRKVIKYKDVSRSFLCWLYFISSFVRLPKRIFFFCSWLGHEHASNIFFFSKRLTSLLGFGLTVVCWMAHSCINYTCIN